ncbi:hypothetical protein GCM10017764_31080 [Sphingobacterium griseoflavum]|uniref:Uncharacterized protein n=1 Tax=Sphingobacterium griseoflavum TaxID=1474952 RepID=A0ABQ3HXW8_9SPHI|nr:hypothetical protein GCM10017764_31080 [Sphingobacterium griseoflavum]
MSISFLCCRSKKRKSNGAEETGNNTVSWLFPERYPQVHVLAQLLAQAIKKNTDTLGSVDL